MSEEGVFTSQRRGETSYLCVEGHHQRCSGVVASNRHLNGRLILGEVTLRFCGCRDCSCAEGADLEAVARKVRARDRETQALVSSRAPWDRK